MLNLPLKEKKAKKKKGFTLFTALVGFIIIGISVLVLQHLSNSEANYNQIFVTIQGETEINTLKDILRLDSYSYVNFWLVEQIADYLNSNKSAKPEEQIYILDIGKNWSEQTYTYEKEKFVGTNPSSSPVVSFFSNAYVTQIYSFSGNYKMRYHFLIYDPLSPTQNLFDPDSKPNIQIGATTHALSNSVSSYANMVTSKKNLKLLELVNCDEEGDKVYADYCENGTFYIPIDMSLLDPKSNQYENILRVLIYRYMDQTSLDDAVLPKNKVKLYVPLRIFGAMSSFLQTIADFNRGTYEPRGFKDWFLGDCDTKCWSNGWAVQQYIKESLPEDSGLLVTLNNLLKNKSEKDFGSDMCEALKDYFDNAVEKNKLGFKFERCKFELKFGNSEFYKNIYINGTYAAQIPCNYLDGVAISFRVIDENPLFTFGEPIAYYFKVELDNRDYIQTSKPLEDILCNYVMQGVGSGGGQLVLQ